MVRFQFSLARELKMTRAELTERVSMREFIDWIAYFTIEQEDQRRSTEEAQDRARAQQMARQMAGYR